MSKKILALVLVVLMVFGLAACAEKAPATQPEAEGGNETPADKPEEGGETADGEKVHLVVPYYGDTAEEYETQAADYEAQGIDIAGEDDALYCEYDMVITELTNERHPDYEVEFVDWGWSEALDQKNRASLTAGNPPSILVGEVYAPNYAQEGICATLAQDLVDSIYPSTIINDLEGNPVMVTTTTALFHVFINMDIYTECGYTEADFPKTWSELKAQSEDITAQGAGEFWGGAIPTFPNAGGTLRTTPWLRQVGADYGTMDSLDSLSSEEALYALQFIRDMGPNLPAGVGDADSESDMWAMWDDGEGNGTVCFILDGTFRDGNNRISGINAACIAIPTPDEHLVDAAANCAVGAVICGVPAAAKYQDACMDIMRILCSEEVGEEWMEGGRAVPSKAAMENYDHEGKGSSEAFLSLCETIQTTETTLPGLVAYQNNAAAVWEIVGQKLTGALTSTDTPVADLVAAVQEEGNPLLAK